jgi:hypothetical protein
VYIAHSEQRSDVISQESTLSFPHATLASRFLTVEYVTRMSKNFFPLYVKKLGKKELKFAQTELGIK